ncbi:hypothetical protein [Pseudoalteromonas piscicida]|uniref:Competence protein CoiA n=1 Tax=Pseudoalteromonas piscicida TaxID=43662 RepID=A0A2A5JTA0_PSEO7|nr:hypothetical protein [Pseudoalteromonas piscicida]PCK32645.1 hypothetical protein CEX98_05950 [Pseudoalteromonas piscicida]
MLVYALNENKQLVHISDVKNGKACNCVCPECENNLIARNAGRVKAHSFAHEVKELETRECRMTALHLFAQRFVKTQSSILLPSHEVVIQNQKFIQPPKSIKINSAEIELSLDKFRIDVALFTEIGPIYIEVKVKSPCTEEKLNFFKSNGLMSMEYDLAPYIGTSFEVVEEALLIPETIAEWIYPWIDTEFVRATLKAIEAQKEAEEHQRRAERLKQEQEAATALKAAEERKKREEQERKDRRDKLIHAIENNLKTTELHGHIKLPSYSYMFKASINGQRFTLKAVPYEGKFARVQNIRVSKIAKTYVRANCDLIKKNNETREFSIIFSLTSKKPRIKLKTHEKAIWAKPNEIAFDYEWLSVPTDEHRNDWAEHEAIKLQLQEFSKHEVKARIELAASYYANHARSGYSYQDYTQWHSWLRKNKNVLSPSLDVTAYPKYKSLSNSFGAQCQLWCFGRWHILLLAEIAEIVDQTNIGSPINPNWVFEKLVAKYPLTNEYHELRNLAESVGVLDKVKRLMDPIEIIYGTLNSFIAKGAICSNKIELSRNYNLRIHMQPTL